MKNSFASLRVVAFIALFALVLGGCPTTPSTDTGPLTFADCEAIVDACHEFDDGSPGPVHDCHETAHDAASNAECAPVRAMCVTLCGAIDGGVFDAADHDHDGGH